MTDGCGLINATALKLLTQRFGYTSMPTAVQGRIAGAKGLWILHPKDTSPVPKIWIRDSQRKITYPSLDRAHRILDLLHVSNSSPMTSNFNLSKQSVLNLWYNGVRSETLANLMKTGLEESIKQLTDWKRPLDMVHLWNAISKNGGVVASRLARLSAGKSRALGFSGREWSRSEDSEAAKDSETENVTTQSSFTGRNPHSGGMASSFNFFYFSLSSLQHLYPSTRQAWSSFRPAFAQTSYLFWLPRSTKLSQ